MKKITICFLIICQLLFCCSCKSKTVTENVFAMDTIMTFSLKGNDAESCIGEIKERIAELEKLFSVTDNNSEISKINSTDSKIKLSDDTLKIIKSSLKISDMTDGSFDITIYPLIEAWGFTTSQQRIPSPEEIDELISGIGYENIIIENDCITYSGRLDLGGIAKGYACDEIQKILQKYDIDDATISLGGNILIKGSVKKVGIQHPISANQLICKLDAKDTSVVTSGGYQRNFTQNDQVYHHILDPKTGKPAQSGIISATIICQDSTLADGLSTAIYVMGTEKATELWKKSKEFDMILVEEDKIYSTIDIEITDTDYKLITIE